MQRTLWLSALALITNGACSVLGPSNETPSVMRLHLGVPGARSGG